MIVNTEGVRNDNSDKTSHLQGIPLRVLFLLANNIGLILLILKFPSKYHEQA